MLGPLAEEHLKMTYHQTLNIPITLGRRPTEGTPADFKESHWDCLKEERQGYLAKPLINADFPGERTTSLGNPLPCAAELRTDIRNDVPAQLVIHDPLKRFNTLKTFLDGNASFQL